MSQNIVIRDGGKTSESGIMRFLRQLSSNGQGPISTGTTNFLNVTQHAGTQNMSVDIQTGEVIIAYQDYCFYGYNTDNPYNLAIAASDPSNPRIDCVVAYEDLSVVSSASNNNPGALKFMDVTGTPAGSPAAPNNTAIQSAVGAGNPFLVLRNVRVNATVTQILNSNLSNAPAPFVIGSNPTYGFYLPASILAIANNQGWNPIAKQAQTFQEIDVYAGVQPAGSSLTIRIYNLTQNQAVGSVSISSGSNQASTTSLTNPTVNKGDVLQIDVTAIGSGTPGGQVTAVIF
jgi:hypothetical protein